MLNILRMVSWSKLWDLMVPNVLMLCVFLFESFRIRHTLIEHALYVMLISRDSSLLAHTLSTHIDTSNDASDILYGLQLRSPLYKFYRLYEHCKRLVYYRSGPIIIKL